MKGIMMQSAQDICGMTKGPHRHKETWWWNEEVAEAVREKKTRYGKWKKENTNEACEWQHDQKKKQKEWANDLNDSMSLKIKFSE